MALDFDWKNYFTPSFSGGFGGTAGWKRPYELAYLNLGAAADTLPAVFQYVPGQRYEGGKRADVRYIEILKTLTGGSKAQIILDTVSDRDIFEVVDNEGTGHMLPRMKWPMRAHMINLQSKSDGSMPSPALFWGMLTKVKPETISDVQDSNQDGHWRYTLDFESFDRFPLGENVGVPTFYHRAIGTADNYHLRYTTSDAVSFDTIISLIVTWMNYGTPDFDFPITFSYTPKAATPYTDTLNTIAIPAMSDLLITHGKSTWQILQDVLSLMGIQEGLGKKYIPTLTIDASGATGTIDVTQGGYDKTAAVDEDFRSTEGMQKDTSTTTTISFNLVKVPFTTTNTAGYYIQFVLYKSDGAGGWTTVKTVPSTGYEYVPFDVFNTHSYRYYKVPTQSAGTYKWDATVVGGGVTIANVGGAVFSPQTYLFMNSPIETDYKKVKTFLSTIGSCSEYGGYAATEGAGQSPLGCMDGGTIGNGGNAWCFDVGYWQACYPDPRFDTTLTGLITITNGSTDVTGSGTAFTTELQKGYFIEPVVDGVYSQVKKINSDTSLTLATAYAGNSKAGVAAEKQEWFHPDYGLLGAVAKIPVLSNENAMDTICRLHSKKQYECHFNFGSKVREPITGTVKFREGYTGNLVGSYVEVYSPQLDDMAIVRVDTQRHVFAENSIVTTLGVFRI